MDEGLLNDLLECSVCLERLDTSSRVLPCQHTFCLKCLKEIVQSHKELRCPECRVPVDVKLEELPPNVLLMRILEGMRNSAPRHQPAPRHHAAQTGSQHGGGVAQRHAGEGKQVPHARAIYDYLSKEPGDLSFKKGDVIYLHKRVDAFWYRGECGARTGIFPVAYVQVMVSLPAPPALCKALYDFRMTAPDEEGCLAFDKGAVIAVIRRVDDNWAEGRLDERVGIFPIAFVELNHAARDLIHSHSSMVVGRAVPPVPEQQPSPRPPHADHRLHQQQAYRHQQMALSTPLPSSQNYQHIANMSQSHPVYHQPPPNPTPQLLVPQSVGPALSGPTVAHRPAEPMQKPMIDLIQFANIHNKSSQQTTMGVQSLMRVGETYDNRLRAVKHDSYNSTPVHKQDKTYNAKRPDNYLISASFNNSSDSSSSVTPSVSVSTSAPNTSSNSSSDSTEPSSPASPENNTETNATTVLSCLTACNSGPAANADTSSEAADTSKNTSGSLRLNESSCSTNTSLNVSLPPPLDSPKMLNVSGGSSTSSGCQKPSASTSQPEAEAKKVDKERHDTPTSSKNLTSYRPSVDLLNFSQSPQAAGSPSRVKDATATNYAVPTRAHRDHHHRERDKRNSLTPGTHLQTHSQHSNQNRHSAEILATSLLDRAPLERDRDKERRRRRSRSGDRQLPAPYIALYPYKPHKPDELELKKGVIYTVMERCQDGWYKGCSTRTQRCGVFPGNYVAPATRKHHEKMVAQMTASAAQKPAAQVAAVAAAPRAEAPDAPPRSASPTPANGPAHAFPWPNGTQTHQKGTDKSRERASKPDKSAVSSGVSLMKRLAAMKKCKSPPPPGAGYSMDNPVFEDCHVQPSQPPHHPQPSHHPVHVRSGSCPSQLLQVMPAEAAMLQGGSVSSAIGHRLFGPNVAMTASHRVAGKHGKERPSVLAVLGGNATVGHAKHHSRGGGEGAWPGAAGAGVGVGATSSHRKTQSLDAGPPARDHRKQHAPPLNERFRCVVPYPPNSEYELELRLDDVVVVHRKRGDGWYKGTLERTGRTGLFPASFVQGCGSD